MTNANVFQLCQPGTLADPLTEILRNGARALLAQAVEAEVAVSVIDGRCDNLFTGWRLAKSSLDKMLGWFPHTTTEWIELIIVTVLLWLLMMAMAAAR